MTIYLHVNRILYTIGHINRRSGLFVGFGKSTTSSANEPPIELRELIKHGRKSVLVQFGVRTTIICTATNGDN